MLSKYLRSLPDRVEPDRIARMDGRRGREPSVSSQISKRLRSLSGRAAARPRAGVPARSDRAQRVIVKAHVSRHRVGKARGGLSRHASYLGRESASVDGQPGVFYDKTRDAVEAKQRVLDWEHDRHHFRFIVSPDRGGDVPDMTAYVRDVMARVERDLGTKLEWVGISHHNTDNPHAHVMVRGRKPDGTDLVVPRRYIASGVRDRASEVATELLGERTAEEARLARAAEVRAERFTSLDRTIERHLGGGRIDLSPSKQIGFGAEDRHLIVARLQFLESLGLAEKDKGTYWQVDQRFRQSLRALDARHDLIRQLYPSMGAEAGRVHRMNAGAEPSPPVAGVVVAVGRINEIGKERFVVVRDGAGAAHYSQIRDDGNSRTLRAGSVVELGGADHRRREVAAQILSVARRHDGVYAAAEHEAHLRAVRPDIAPTDLAAVVRSATARLEALAGRNRSGVERLDSARFRIQTDTFERITRRAGGRAGVRMIAAHGLDEQIEARAVTWLDRWMLGEARDARTVAGPVIERAADRRAQWLVRNGYADAADQQGQPIRLRAGALQKLAAEERSAAYRALEKQYGRPVSELPQGGTATGSYGGVRELHAGHHAVVVTDARVYVAPVKRAPDVAVGGAVTLRNEKGRGASMQSLARASAGARAGSRAHTLEVER